MARITGLQAGTSVAISMIDAHAAGPAVGVLQDDSMVLAMGTSLCHILVNRKEVLLEGIGGVVRDGVVPGYYGYEAGQAAVGDIYNWFISNLASADCFEQSAEDNISPLAVMDARAARLRPGERGLLALDWWNGNKTPFVDGRLSGVLAGCTLGTKPEEIYRALIEATAFGTRRIVDLYEEAGAQIEEIIASGGIAEKNPLFLQIYADVLGKRIRVSATEQTAAVGSAVYASVAAGAAGGGYETLQEAVERMSRIHEKAYEPDPENQKTYQELYELYKELSGLFDPGKNTVLAKLLEIKSR